jgi:sec-independent protein translocase protein TatA
MGNFSFWEIALIFLAILLLFGARRIPEIAGSLGKGIREFKRSVSDVERSITEPERPAARLPADQPPPVRSETAKTDDDRPEPRRLLS